MFEHRSNISLHFHPFFDVDVSYDVNEAVAIAVARRYVIAFGLSSKIHKNSGNTFKKS